ncbi:MAG: 3-hydroxybutyryl-CoA dehydrogenase [Dehalococcoidia bacterium]|nr:3-hydroxybutyryl-CoA dehydrogenase [Dehalococcoidia bacterium]
MEIKKVGVVGCGFMGSGIVQVCAQSGYQVVVSETNDELLNKGIASIDYYLTRGVEKGRLSQQDKDSALGRIRGTTNIKDFNDCDLIIEAVPEDMDLKKKIFTELNKICLRRAILATNTSCLSIIDLAMVTSKPDKVLGMHFCSPVPVNRLLEIVKTVATSDDTLEIGKQFGKSVGKTVIVAKDTPGFIFNRLLIPWQLNAVRMLEAGIATRDDIDNSMKLGLNYPIGPLALCDFNGIDVVYMVARAMYEETKDPQYAPPVLMKRMLAAGWLGRKTGKGFYEYNK